MSPNFGLAAGRTVVEGGVATAPAGGVAVDAPGSITGAGCSADLGSSVL
jgi:hypothetical protein